jgi:hypothetical protein
MTIGFVWKDRRTIEERYQLITSALRAQSEGNGGESANRVQAEKNIVMLLCVLVTSHTACGCCPEVVRPGCFAP